MKLTLTRATKIATHVAKESSMMRHQLGAVLFDKSQYVTGFNRVYGGCQVQNKYTPYSEHAEAAVINRALHIGIDMEHSVLVVVRVNKSGQLMLARPCTNCTKLINSMNIPYIYYSNDPLRRELIQTNFKSL